MHNRDWKINNQKYFKQMKKFYDLLMLFIETEDDDDNENNFQNLIQHIKSQKIEKSKEEFEHFLRLLSNISNNYNRKTGFITKIEKILHFYSNEIHQFCSNIEMFNIFKNNKIIILFLLENSIIEFDEFVIKRIMEQKQLNGINYCHFFWTEIGYFYNKLNEMPKLDLNNLENFDEKRRIGLNDSYICTLIRDDSIEDFVSYVNQNNIPLSGQISPSIYETNQFLIEKMPTLIEYATFYGAIQIFQYLKINNVEFSPSLWYYAIHSKNAEMINILEENNVKPEDNSYIDILGEAIKCHHNDIAHYIENNLITIDQKDKNINFAEEVSDFAFCYSNYSFIPNDLNQSFVFFSLCNYHYNKIVDTIIKNRRNEMESMIVLN